MINIEVSCRTILDFHEGQISGYILVSPESILESIMINTSLNFGIPERFSIMKLIAKETSNRDKSGESKDIKLLSGTVDRNYVTITLQEAIDFIGDYIHIDNLMKDINSKFTVTSSNTEKKHKEEILIDDFNRMKDYIYRCDNCNIMSDTVNIKF